MQSIQLIQKENWRREKLRESIDFFRSSVASLNCQLMPSETAMQPIVIGDNQKALDLSRELFERGLHVTAIRPPTVPANTARLRITLSAAHEKSHIDALIKALSELLGR